MGLLDIANKMRRVEGWGVGPLAEKLHARLVEMNKTDRRDDSDGWHISSIPYLCCRELALRSLFPKPADVDDWEPRALMRVDVGSAIHRWWQNQYLGPAGILLGNWVCLGKCQRRWKEQLMPARWCECGGRIEYEEMKVRDEATAICGSTDGVLVLEGSPGGALERFGFDLKTSNEDSMSRMKQPPEGHVFQLNLYMHLLGLKRGLLVYVDPVCRFWRDAMSKAANSGTGESSLPILEFVVEYDPKWWTKAVEKVKMAQKIKAELALQTWAGPLPDRICDTPKQWRAEDCPVAAECFDEGIEAKVVEKLRKSTTPH